VRADAFWLMTVPVGAELATRDTAPTASPAATIELAAAVSSRPITFGTVVGVPGMLLTAMALVYASGSAPPGRAPSSFNGLPETYLTYTRSSNILDPQNGEIGTWRIEYGIG